MPMAMPILNKAALGFGLVYRPLILDHTHIKRLLMIKGEDKTVHSINSDVMSR